MLALVVGASSCATSQSAGGDYALPLYRPTTRATGSPVAVRWRLLEASGGEAAAAPIVFLPALGLSGHSWLGVASRLTRRAPRLLVDLPGIGEAPEVGAFDDDDILRALTELVDSVAPGGPIMLVGHSLGGAIATRLAAQLGTRVQALVLVGAPVAPFALERWERLLLAESLWPPFFHLLGPSFGVRTGLGFLLRREAPASPLDVALIASDWSDRRRRDAIVAYYRAFLEPARIETSRRALAEVRAPTLLLWGDHDAIVPKKVMDRAQAELRAVPVTTHVVKGGGHLLPLGSASEVAAAIDRFVAEQLGAPISDHAPSSALPDCLAARRCAAQMGRHPADRVWGPARELFPLLSVGALVTTRGQTDLSLLLGLARGGIDPHYPVEAGRLALFVGASVRAARDPSAWAFAYLRATARLELVWRWVGGLHLDGTLLFDPRDRAVGGLGAVGYAASVVPWLRLFVAGGHLPHQGRQLLFGAELDLPLIGWLY